MAVRLLSGAAGLMSDPAEYDCEGCGWHVFNFGRDAPPGHRLCAVCHWLCVHEPPERLMDLRRVCEPGGWESERKRRKASAND
jgi:hypothetical protein